MFTAGINSYCIIYLLLFIFSDTVSRSGVYCSVSIALEQCKVEGVVDVFQVTKAVKRNKPGAVTTLVLYYYILLIIHILLYRNSIFLFTMSLMCIYQ